MWRSLQKCDIVAHQNRERLLTCQQWNMHHTTRSKLNGTSAHRPGRNLSKVGFSHVVARSCRYTTWACGAACIASSVVLVPRCAQRPFLSSNERNRKMIQFQDPELVQNCTSSKLVWQSVLQGASAKAARCVWALAFCTGRVFQSENRVSDRHSQAASLTVPLAGWQALPASSAPSLVTER